MATKRHLIRFLNTASDARTFFVGISLLVNLLFLVRSYVFLLVLDYRELGLVALLQSIVLLLGILQFGILSGGYRLLISETGEGRTRVNDFVYSFMLVLGIAAIAIATALAPFFDRPEDGLMAVLGAIGGAATLVRSHQTNQMVAGGRLTTLNWINFGSAAVSLGILGFVTINPLLFSMASLVAQPILFVAATWLVATDGRPTAFRLDRVLGSRILATGFVLFAAGMLLQVNVQLERWYVTALLGVEALGHLFLATMAFTLIQLVPTALDTIFLPATVRAHAKGDGAALERTMRQYLCFLLGHAILAWMAIWLLAEPVLALLAPKYIPDLVYVYLIAPGALVLSVASAFSVTFSVLLRFRALLVAYAAGTIALAGVLGWSAFTGMPLSLSGVSTVRSAGMALTAVLIVAGWWAMARSHPDFRFGIGSRRAD